MREAVEAPMRRERRTAERHNVYLRFDFRTLSSGAAAVAGSGVTINMSHIGALLLMSRCDIGVGVQIEILFRWRGGGRPGAPSPPAFLGNRTGPEARGEQDDGMPDGERMVKTRAVVVRIQPLDGFGPSPADCFGVSVGFMSPLR